jgi:hypothetical protein
MRSEIIHGETTNATTHAPTARRFAFLWTRATIAGAALGLVVMFTAAGPALNHAPGAVFGAGVGLVFGATTGWRQQRVLRRRYGTARCWVIVTAIGWCTFWAVNLAGGGGSGGGVTAGLLESLVHGALFGFVLGALQFLALRHLIPRAGRWLGVSVLAWLVGAIVGDALVTFTGGPVDLLAGTLVATAIGGYWLEVLAAKRGHSPASTRSHGAGQRVG